jgi:hypothetical protein
VDRDVNLGDAIEVWLQPAGSVSMRSTTSVWGMPICDTMWHLLVFRVLGALECVTFGGDVDPKAALATY